jgi:hypothetical protein
MDREMKKDLTLALKAQMRREEPENTTSRTLILPAPLEASRLLTDNKLPPLPPQASSLIQQYLFAKDRISLSSRC